MTAFPAFQPTTVPLPADAVPTKALLDYVPRMSLKERDRRWDQVRKQMRMANLDALVFLGNDIYWAMGMANLRYMFQVDSQIGGDALFVLDGPPIVWTGVQHMNRPTSPYLSVTDWMTDFRTRVGPRGIAAELRDRGLHESRIGLVGFNGSIQLTSFLHDDIEILEKELPKATMMDATHLLSYLRLRKSEEELDMLRAAGKIARKVVDTMIASARPGATEAEVYADMIRTQIANGADPNVFNLLSSGPVEHPKNELWHLLHGSEQPISPTRRPLSNGDIMIAEFHTKYGGYRCHTEFTVYIGKKPPKELQNIWDVSVECLDASKEALVAGRTFREAWEIVRKPAERAGLDFVELGFHAMGTASPEFPSIVYPPGYGRPNANGHRIGDFILEEGMTFGNNIDLHDSRWKPDVGCMYADFMVVRPNRAECLVNVPRELPCTGDSDGGTS
jgi:Xaa-Pro aminopeptidase